MSNDLLLRTLERQVLEQGDAQALERLKALWIRTHFEELIRGNSLSTQAVYPKVGLYWVTFLKASFKKPWLFGTRVQDHRVDRAAVYFEGAVVRALPPEEQTQMRVCSECVRRAEEGTERCSWCHGETFMVVAVAEDVPHEVGERVIYAFVDGVLGVESRLVTWMEGLGFATSAIENEEGFARAAGVTARVIHSRAVSRAGRDFIRTQVQGVVGSPEIRGLPMKTKEMVRERLMPLVKDSALREAWGL